MNTPKSAQQGFTLIELMVVIAIIGILSAIAIPTYKNHTKKSEATVAVSTCSALLTNIELQIQEAGSFPTDLAKVGARSDMSRLGTLSLTQDTDDTESGSLLFTFGSNSGLNGKKVKYTKSSTTGWQCSQSAFDDLKTCGYVSAL